MPVIIPGFEAARVKRNCQSSSNEMPRVSNFFRPQGGWTRPEVHAVIGTSECVLGTVVSALGSVWQGSVL